MCQRIQDKTGAKFIKSGEDKDVILGNGTVMYEFHNQMGDAYGKELDAVILPIGVGSLMAGASIASVHKRTRLFGAEPELAQHCSLRVKDKRRHHLPLAATTIADGLRLEVGDLPFSILERKVEKFFTATESQIAQAMKVVFSHLKLTIEASAAVAVAVLLYNTDFRYLLQTEGLRNVGIILEGGNVDLDSQEYLMPWLCVDVENEKSL